MEYEKEGITAREKENFITSELDAIDRELKELDTLKQSSKPQTNVQNQCKSNKVDLNEVIGVETKPVEQNSPIFLTPKNIKAAKRDVSQIVSTGIELMDKRIMGLIKGELSVWSGSNASGKSSILSQIAINSINNNFKVALFSGELRADRVLNWIQLQCSGKAYTESTKYENFYTVAETIKDRINSWLEEKLFIYNNDYGSKVEKVLKAINDCIKENKVDVVIIDNLMALDLASINGEKYDKQTSLVLALSQLAKKQNVVVNFVAHPRKSMGFLRKQDISGSSDITNLADNVFIVHRCNTDFKRNIKEYLSIKDDNQLLKYDNVIEICKNRDLGISDEFIGVYYEKESKRFLNSINETRHYNWEYDSNGFRKSVGNDNVPFET